jgi:hypothetical protein
MEKGRKWREVHGGDVAARRAYEARIAAWRLTPPKVAGRLRLGFTFPREEPVSRTDARPLSARDLEVQIDARTSLVAATSRLRSVDLARPARLEQTTAHGRLHAFGAGVAERDPDASTSPEP